MTSIQIFNSLTSSLDHLVSKKERHITWYTCGPTVYDASHLGHARNYVAQDVIRRILEDYFRYDVDIVMNITDIDDKIIARAQELQVPPAELTQKYEREFFRDMDRLNVRRPSMLTRVSDYIPNIITYIKQIIDNNFAYPSGGSVYFDLKAYTQKFPYGRLHRFDDSTLDEESMSGRLKDKNSDKRSQSDFALWKTSKDGEPFWDSPWGPGRPGWHIECSVMATAILGPTFDIHSGGEDLRFPHHENELAQAIAHNNTSNQWVSHFVHTGHLHIDGRKMSKSLKNFITIDEALKTYTPRQLRLLFLLHHYRATLNYSDNAMRTALDTENNIQEFLNQTRGVINSSETATWALKEIILKTRYSEVKEAITTALSTDFDTPQVFEAMNQLIKYVYSYMSQDTPNTYLVKSIRDYLTNLLTIFGLVFDQNTQNAMVPLVLDATTEFRDCIRRLLKDPHLKDAKALRGELFKLSDHYRDVILPSIGIHLDDTPTGKGVWKIT